MDSVGDSGEGGQGTMCSVVCEIEGHSSLEWLSICIGTTHCTE